MIALIYIVIAFIVSVISNYLRNESIVEAVFLGAIWPLTIAYCIYVGLIVLGTEALEILMTKFWVCWYTLTNKEYREAEKRK